MKRVIFLLLLFSCTDPATADSSGVHLPLACLQAQAVTTDLNNTSHEFDIARMFPPGLQLRSGGHYSTDWRSESNPFDSNIKEASNNPSMNYQSTNKISAILSCSLFSMAYRPL
jgi:hypothetical protein